jgi:hypothetical protein
MKPNQLLIIMFLIFTYSHSQILFEDRVVLDHKGDINELKDLSIVDLDNDGDLDIVSISSPDNKLAWFENLNGQGSFGSIQFIDNSLENQGFSYSSDFYATYTADIDGDGLIDVISNASETNEISWYKNLNGPTQFGNKQIISSNSSGNGFGVPFDIDNDNDIDIISKSGSNLVWYNNTDGMGNFSSAINIPNTEPGSVHLADIDNDNDLDIISSNNSGNSIHWYENLDGFGTFGAQQLISIYGEGGYDIVSSDIDNDGDLDIITSNSSEQRIYWYENLDGEGNFSPLNVVSTSIPNCYSIDSADIDNDGDNDVLSSTTQGIVWFENINGQGIFSIPQTLVNNIDGSSIVNIADIDGDNDLDIVSGGQVEDAIAWYDNVDGQASFFSHQNITYDYNFVNIEYTFGDIDGDGFQDLITDRHWFKNNNGELDYPKMYYSGNFGYNYYFSADIDNDNDVDIIGLNYDTNNDLAIVRWSENTGEGNLNSPQTLFSITDTNGYQDFITKSDLNSDGLLDIIFVNDSEGITWYENLSGSGTTLFGTGQPIGPNVDNNVRDIKTIDIDGDSDIDVIVSGNNSITLFRNTDGAGNFDSGVIINQHLTSPYVFISSTNINFVDFDGDGDLDLLTSGEQGESDPWGVPTYQMYLAWQENLNGLGDYGEKNILYSVLGSPGYGTVYSFSSDIDNDGDFDIVSVRQFNIDSYNSDYDFFWYENTDGNGNFNAHSLLFDDDSNFLYSIERIKKIQPLDFDNDGNIDIIYLVSGAYFSFLKDKLLWKKNAGIALSVQEFESSYSTIYPNPTRDNLFIKSKIEVNRIEIFDLAGNLIKNYTYDNNFVNVSELSNGIYVIKIIEINGVSETKKFIKK